MLRVLGVLETQTLNSGSLVGRGKSWLWGNEPSLKSSQFLKEAHISVTWNEGIPDNDASCTQ